jgi:methylated-DNA-[protein]-cysteine S-methyltransferase
VNSLQFPSPLGDIFCSVDDSGALVRLDFLAYKKERPAMGMDSGGEHIARQVNEYFAGTRRSFDVPLAPPGTRFQQRVWKELQAVPFGAAITYRELAARAGSPKAPRAAGRANATNPICLLIPCHRVIGADGSLTGYGGGLPIKEALLRWEGVALPRIRREVWTIGHSNHPIDRFIELLRHHEIEAVADTRSQPYSRYAPQFNQTALRESLAAAEVRYVYLGEELGGKPRRPDRLPLGIVRLLKGAVDHRIAVLCAEENPLQCHRWNLITPALEKHGLQVTHIRGDGRAESGVDLLPLAYAAPL